MKAKSATILVVIILLTSVLGFFTAYTGEIGDFRITSIAGTIKQGLDLRGGVYAVYQAEDDGTGDFQAKLNSTISILTARLTSQGYTEAAIVKQGTDRIRVEIPDVQDPQQVLDLIGTPAHLEFVEPDGTVIFTGEHVKEASPQVNSQTGQYVVSFNLDSEGAVAFAAATARLIGSTIDIKLDGESLFGAYPPTVEGVISGGTGMISGNYTFDSAKALASLIQSGALPMYIEQIEVRTISATLGVNALSTSITAGLIGVVLVMLFMIAIYKLPGLVSALALAIYIILDVICLAVVGAQLTLPGIAGIVLSIGMAVDANVVIFERIKEELGAGAMLRPAINNGFKNAFRAIIDSNVTTLISAIVLGIFGTGSIKGFAITLGVGVVVSMFTAIVVTRYLLNLMLGFGIVNKRLYGLKVKEAQV